MKRRSIVPVLIACCQLVSCWHHRTGTAIQFYESNDYYSMNAWFNENKTRAVEEYMDDQIGQQNNTSFANTTIDGMIGLDDHTTFFLKKTPGHVKIELDKRNNTRASYRQIKSLCEGIKGVVK
ncbi:MAG TPA: hypothetical protein VI385_01610 [Flavisolibacter sp.]